MTDTLRERAKVVALDLCLPDAELLLPVVEKLSAFARHLREDQANG